MELVSYLPEPDHWLQPLLDSWELDLGSQNKSDRTIQNYLEALHQFVGWLAEEHPDVDDAAQVTVEVCRGWIGHLVATRKVGTAQTRWAAMRQFWKWAAEEDEIPVNPMESVKRPANPDDQVPPEVLTPDQVRAILATCSGSSLIERRDFAIMTLFADTGMRVSALAGAQLGKLDLRERVVEVTEKGRRTVVLPFGVKAARALDRYLRARVKHQFRVESPAVFISTRDGRAITADTVRQMMSRRGAEAGVPGLHPHLWRHTFVDNWLRSGGSESDLMELVNWKSRDMLGRYAAKTRNERAHAAHRRLSPMDNFEG